ncbi:MAG: GHKL domain-containing protein [Bacteroides sp.]|nr:GHKL domain-containing protein [Bacteroidales bacterium]MBD5336610.1 GHKL domain-containing protein [Bacteroides sp.]
MASIYERQRIGKYVFLTVSIVAIVVFLLISNSLVKQLANQERERMKIWAKATERLASADASADVDFLLDIIAQNNSIPVMVIDSEGHILDFRNFKLPEEQEEMEGESVGMGFDMLSDKNRQFLEKRLHSGIGESSLEELAGRNPHVIRVEVMPEFYQYIYYEDSILLRRLSLYPYIQLGVMAILTLIICSAVLVSKRAEQNRVWVGLSKETAHQLGTPISSLMAWSEYLALTGTDPEVTKEIDKDVRRLSTIAERFSKIGSNPELQLEYLNDRVGSSLEYMRSRISGKVELRLHLSDDDHATMLSGALFEWVMENLTKNAVDAMEGAGKIDITTGAEKDRVWIEIKDTGKGIAKKNFKNVFNPGFTTKKRGWGLGLTLVKRIIEEYHGGRIFVKESEPGKGTTFRIELPKAEQIKDKTKKFKFI